MDPVTTKRLEELLAQNQHIGIVVGRNPDLDAMAAALSLFLSLSASGKNTTVASPTPPIVALSSLVGIDKVKASLKADGGDLVVSFPYKEGEIEKVSYTIDGGLLNIMVKAGEQGLSFSENDVVYSRSSSSLGGLLFIVGTSRLSDLGELFDPATLKDTTVVNIDNKKENQGFGDIVLVSEKFSSVSEQVASLLASVGLALDVDIAQNLLLGIASATDNFQNPNTSSVAFEMAALLMQRGAVRKAPPKPLDGSAYLSEEDFLLPDDMSTQEVSPPPLVKAKDTGVSQRKKPPADWLVPKVYKGSTEV